MRRQQVAYAEARGLSRRRACALLAIARSTLGSVLRLVAPDAPVVVALRMLSAAQYPRYGYRTMRSFLEREGDVRQNGSEHSRARFHPRKYGR